MERDPTRELLDWVKSHYFGKYRGRVTDNADPTRRGRLKVQVPAVLESLEVWAMPCVPYAGKGVGFYSLPEPDTGVWVEFEGGDPSYPVWTGCFWTDDELPDTGGPSIKVWKTEKAMVRIDDEAGELKMANANDSKLTLGPDAKTESGGATHTVGGSGIVSELGSGKVEVTPVSVRLNDSALEVT